MQPEKFFVYFATVFIMLIYDTHELARIDAENEYKLHSLQFELSVILWLWHLRLEKYNFISYA